MKYTCGVCEKGTSNSRGRCSCAEYHAACLTKRRREMKWRETVSCFAQLRYACRRNGYINDCLHNTLPFRTCQRCGTRYALSRVHIKTSIPYPALYVLAMSCLPLLPSVMVFMFYPYFISASLALAVWSLFKYANKLALNLYSRRLVHEYPASADILTRYGPSVQPSAYKKWRVPQKTICRIFSFLQPKELLTVSATNKQWYAIICAPGRKHSTMLYKEHNLLWNCVVTKICDDGMLKRYRKGLRAQKYMSYRDVYLDLISVDLGVACCVCNRKLRVSETRVGIYNDYADHASVVMHPPCKCMEKTKSRVAHRECVDRWYRSRWFVPRTRDVFRCMRVDLWSLHKSVRDATKLLPYAKCYRCNVQFSLGTRTCAPLAKLCVHVLLSLYFATHFVIPFIIYSYTSAYRAHASIASFFVWTYIVPYIVLYVANVLLMKTTYVR